MRLFKDILGFSISFLFFFWINMNEWTLKWSRFKLKSSRLCVCLCVVCSLLEENWISMMKNWGEGIFWFENESICGLAISFNPQWNIHIKFLFIVIVCVLYLMVFFLLTTSNKIRMREKKNPRKLFIFILGDFFL